MLLLESSQEQPSGCGCSDLSSPRLPLSYNGRPTHAIVRCLNESGSLTGDDLVHAGGMQPNRHKWRSTLAEVIQLLNDLDPYGLEPGTTAGAPQDEYETEASPIASLLLNNGSVSRNQVDAIWQAWFQESLSEVIGDVEAERFCISLNSLSDST